MTSSFSPRLCLAALAALALLLPARVAAQSYYYVVVKDGNYTQKSPSTVAYSSSTPFQFSALSNLAATLTSPNDAAGAALVASSADGDYEINGNYATETLMDAAYPSGTYGFTSAKASFTVTEGPDQLPELPSITNGTWNSGGQLEIDPTAIYTFDFSSFPAFGKIGVASEVLLTIIDSTGAAVVDVYWTTPAYTASPTTYVMPKGTLTAGATYTAHLDYSLFTTDDQTDIPDSVAEVEFGSYTTFTIIANAPPTSTITAATQPLSQTVASGATAVLSFGVAATPAATYQWYFDGSAVLGATSSSIVVTDATAASAGAYYCVASNAAGSVTSSTASLAVSTTSDIGHLIDISCRAQVGTGGSILITGFALGGTGTSGDEQLLIRASGPALANYSVTGYLPDPKLELYTDTTVLDSDYVWGGTSAISTAAASVGAFAWNVQSDDSALLKTLGAGAYTAQVLGDSGDTGIALAEIYDVPSGGVFSPTSPRLVNISARVEVGTGANILIAGFVIGGSTSETVLIRATGPTLEGFGVTGTLADPELQLKDSAGNLLFSNTVWGGDANITAAASKVGAFKWASASADSALLVTLPPGAYTAAVSGASADTGVALVEIYDIP